MSTRSLCPAVLLAAALPVAAQDTESSDDNQARDFGGPTTVAGQLEEDAAAKGRLSGLNRHTESQREWRDALDDRTGLKLGWDMNTLAQFADSSLTGEDTAWGGIARLYGRWAVVNRDEPGTGFLSFKVEYRSALGGFVDPQSFYKELGYLGLTDIIYSDRKAILTDFNYQKRLGRNDRAAVVVGRFDPNAFQDVLAYSNPYTGFTNANIVSNFSVALPDYSWGVAAGTWLGETNQWYISGNINDANGNPGNVEFFEDGAEFYKSIEVGWSPKRARRYHSTAHVMFWHVDARETKGIPSGKGVAMSAAHTFSDDTWMVFGRYGQSDGRAPFFNQSVTLGFAHMFEPTTDRLAFALQWGEPSDNSLRNQLTTELLYRFQLADSLQLTSSIQYIKDPANNPVEDSLVVWSIRIRYAL
jgi:porin